LATSNSARLFKQSNGCEERPLMLIYSSYTGDLKYSISHSV